MGSSDQLMAGRVCLITGATSGIGRMTADALAAMGATLFLVARDRVRGEDTCTAIRRATGNERVQLLLADLASLDSIRALVRAFLATGEPLHVLINNAGVVNLSRRLTQDGIEEVFAVNHLAYFLVTHLLLDRLRASAPARIINVASEAHKFGNGIDFGNLQGERSFRTMRIYGQSKLANILFTYELARRLDGTGVTVNCLHPGAVATGLGKNNGRWAGMLIALLRPFFRTPEKGAETSIYLASSPDVTAVSGRYFYNCKPIRSAPASYDEAAARRLWDESARLVGVVSGHAVCAAPPRAAD
jgi:NAD(P)-dependent dehydrogenase (short-subunit alcohol dehydrogenase family)